MMKNTIPALLSLSFAVSASPQVTAPELTQQITTQGAKTVIANLYKDNEYQWQYVLTNIGSGETSWLTVASRLAPGRDAVSA